MGFWGSRGRGPTPALDGPKRTRSPTWARRGAGVSNPRNRRTRARHWAWGRRTRSRRPGNPAQRRRRPAGNEPDCGHEACPLGRHLHRHAARGHHHAPPHLCRAPRANSLKKTAVSGRHLLAGMSRRPFFVPRDPAASAPLPEDFESMVADYETEELEMPAKRTRSYHLVKLSVRRCPPPSPRPCGCMSRSICTQIHIFFTHCASCACLSPAGRGGVLERAAR